MVAFWHDLLNTGTNAKLYSTLIARGVCGLLARVTCNDNDKLLRGNNNAINQWQPHSRASQPASQPADSQRITGCFFADWLKKTETWLGRRGERHVCVMCSQQTGTTTTQSPCEPLSLQLKLASHRPHIHVHTHTHRPLCVTQLNTLYFLT